MYDSRNSRLQTDAGNLGHPDPAHASQAEVDALRRFSELHDDQPVSPKMARHLIREAHQGPNYED